MARKPTYEELEQRNKDLQKEIDNCKRTEEALRECEKRFKSVTNSIEELLVLLDQNFKVQVINTTLAAMSFFTDATTSVRVVRQSRF